MLNNITMLSVLLSGAALLREREHGTLEHLLVMPVGPTEIMVSKVLANALIIITVTAVCVYGMLRGIIGLHAMGSVGLFLFGTLIYLFFATSLGYFSGHRRAHDAAAWPDVYIARTAYESTFRE